MKQLITESLLAYQFWTLFQALAPMIWFYPLNELEISGYEAYAVILFSPILLMVPYLQTILKNKYGLIIFRFFALLGILSFQTNSTLNRLYVLCFGCFFQMLIFTIKLGYPNEKYRKRYEWSLILGLISFIVSRIWLVSFVPAWWNNICNSVVFFLCLIANIFDVFQADHVMVSEEIKKKTDDHPLISRNAEKKCWLRMGIGFGSLLYTTQAIFGEVSLITRWTVKGYPDSGPMPYPCGVLVLVFLIMGAYMSQCTHVVHSYAWWVLGCCSFFGLYYLNTWSAFFAGLILSSFISSIWPTMLSKVAQTRHPHKTICLSIFIWLFYMLFSVWTVAYNFVPGGVYTREKTNLLIGFVSVSWMVSLTAIVKGDPERHTGKRDLQNINHKANYLLLFLLIAGMTGFIFRYPNQHFNHSPKPERTFTAAIWTFHFGYDNKGWPSLVRAASMLEETGADVITLLESDASKPYLGNNDLGMWLGERLKMHVDFGPSTRDHTWGNLLLSKYPIIKSVHHLLPSPHVNNLSEFYNKMVESDEIENISYNKQDHIPIILNGELAPAITATVNISGDLVNFVVTHMGNDRDVLDRKLQAQFLAAELKQATNPVVFLGYVTSAPFSRDYEELIVQGKVKDIDSTDIDRWCEYIMYRGLKRLGYARLSHGGLSDTEIQMARFFIPTQSNNDSWQDNDRITIDPMKVHQDIRFSAKFGPHNVGHNWLERHKYHMNTPKYFI